MTEQFDETHLRDASDYHNEGIDALRNENANKAFQVVQLGLQLFPFDVDLLADAVEYAPMFPAPAFFEGLGIEDIDKATAAEVSYQRLKSSGFRKSWRAYTFAIDYLIDRKLCTLGKDDATNLLTEAYNLACDFVSDCPKDERAYRSKAKVLESIESYGLDDKHGPGKGETSENVLKTAVMNQLAPQCCIRYMDRLLDDGRFEEAEHVAMVGLKATTQSQPSANVDYFLFGLALSRDHLLISRAFPNNELVPTAQLDTMKLDVSEIIRLYARLIHSDSLSLSYKTTCHRRLMVLGALFNEEVEAGETDVDPAQLQAIAELLHSAKENEGAE